MSFSKHSLSGEFLHNKATLTSLCEVILDLFEQSDEIVQAGRNTLKKVTFEGRDCVVKAFRIPSVPQNYSYGMLAKSKAKKSYDNGQKLLELGLLTPAPVGYFEYRSGGKLMASYYICEYAADVETLHDIRHREDGLNANLMEDFARYCYQLHSKGILHRDFNPKNILISENERGTAFSIVDINRITWYQKLSLEKAMESLSRLPFDGEIRTSILEKYAELSGVDVKRCQNLLNRSQQKTQRYFRNKRRLRKIFPKKR